MEFNQEKTHIIFYDNEHINIINIQPYQLVCTIKISSKIKLSRMFYKSNLIFFVGYDQINYENSYGSNILNIYDDARNTIINKVQINTEIDDFQIVTNYISILSGKYIYVYTYENLENYIFKFETSNKNFYLTNNILIYAEKNKSDIENIKIVKLSNNNIIEFKAHENKIKFMTINNDETIMATASERGTIIRLFDVNNGTKLFEFRRGATTSVIQYITFSSDSKFLAVLSDKGTIHIYNLKNLSANRKSMLSVLGGYFDSEWSFAWFYDNLTTQIKKCCFDINNDLLIISNDLSCQKISFNKESGGLCNLIDKYNPKIEKS